ncbi:MAG UNVERIFIED_CONTAM: hypothetical protein LVQ98_06710 [Rickettsiaceae bacterium]|jgi:uncharacterized protein YjbI with pentapeptide repeats
MADAKLIGATIEGGAINNTDLFGTDFTKATLGTKDKPTSVKGSSIDQSTNFTDTNFGSGKDPIKQYAPDRSISEHTLEEAQQQNVSNK